MPLRNDVSIFGRPRIPEVYWESLSNAQDRNFGQKGDKVDKAKDVSLLSFNNDWNMLS